jgi:hypothetical protein
MRTRQGRRATVAAYDHLGLKRPERITEAMDDALPFEREVL